MKVFISWSGERSKAIALAMRQFVEDVIQRAEPFVSAANIDAGSRWPEKLKEELKSTCFGIVCLTPDNLKSQWIHFEAGALSNAVDRPFICPYLTSLSPGDLGWPLAQFQANVSNKSGTWEIIKSLNQSMGQDALPLTQLERSFERCWLEFEKRLAGIEDPEPVQAEQSHLEKMVEETLVLVRGLSAPRLQIVPGNYQFFEPVQGGAVPVPSGVPSIAPAVVAPKPVMQGGATRIGVRIPAPSATTAIPPNING